MGKGQTIIERDLLELGRDDNLGKARRTKARWGEEAGVLKLLFSKIERRRADADLSSAILVVLM